MGWSPFANSPKAHVHNESVILLERRKLATPWAEAGDCGEAPITLRDAIAESKATSVFEQMNLIGEQLNSLKTEEITMGASMEETPEQIMNLAGTWHKANLDLRKKLQFALFPDGLRYSPEKLFFEPVGVREREPDHLVRIEQLRRLPTACGS